MISTLIMWSPWFPLSGCWRTSNIPADPGLYRIRRTGASAIDYIGQTGSGTMTLRKRLAMLKGVYDQEMPYRDPHTAGPALWALRQINGCDFEVSVALVQGSTPWRKALECVAIAQYRQEYGLSPTISFGRMPLGYHMSSANNAKLVATGKRFRGGITDLSNDSHLPSLPPLGTLGGDVTADHWCGLFWSAWQRASSPLPVGSGVYRLRTVNAKALVYIGEGAVGSRVIAHLDKVRQLKNPQGAVFACAQPLEVSSVINGDWYKHQRLEVENDLIAAHALELGAQPAGQFIG